MAITCFKTFTVSGCSYDTKLSWAPAALDLPAKIGYEIRTDDESITEIILLQTTLSTFVGGGGFLVHDAPTIQTISAPNLTTAYYIDLTGNTALTSVSMPLLVTATTGIFGRNCTSLADLDFSAWLPTVNTNNNFTGSALTQASVDHLLARCVANPAFAGGFSRLFMTGGTNAAPSVTGLADKATLLGRGCNVTSN